MCGIVGIVGQSPVNQRLYDALTVLQHRGQDAAGIVTDDNNQLHLRKNNGLVKDVFHTKHMKQLEGNTGIGHVRYPTAGTSHSAEAQPFYVNSPYGIAFAHNGNLTNSEELRKKLCNQGLRHINTNSDSELLLNIFAQALQDRNQKQLNPQTIFNAVTEVHERCQGGYAAITLIANYGLVAFRDPHGIRPIIIGKRESNNGPEYIVASESVALDMLDFKHVRDVAPGETIIIEKNGAIHHKVCHPEPKLNPCLFEYVYLARPDSCIDKISVYSTHVRMGQKLADKIKNNWKTYANDIDVVIPIPDTGRCMAIEAASALNKNYREGFVKNRYIGRTFIMPGQTMRKRSVRQKLNLIQAEFKDKNVLLIDDSIVRGTTCQQIIELAREAGAKKVYFASGAPAVRYPNVYGIDMPVAEELIAHNRTDEEVCKIIGADKLIYQDLDDLVSAACEENPEVKQFEASVFDGHYVTGDVTTEYLHKLQTKRNDNKKQKDSEAHNTIELHNNS